MNDKRYTVYGNGNEGEQPPKPKRSPRLGSRDKAAGRKAKASGPHLGSGPGARSGSVGQLPGWQPAAAGGAGAGSVPPGAGNGPRVATGPAGREAGPARQVYAKPRRRWPLIVGIVVLVFFAGLSGVGGYAYGIVQAAAHTLQANYKGAVGDKGVAITTASSSEAQNVLLIGSDRREKSVEGQDDPGRSDTMMLVRMDPNTGSISMLSVPRDLWVHIPGYGMERINVAYTLGGPAKTVAMFKELTGLPINGFIDVNFLGFVHVVDVLGGAYIDCDRRYYNPPGTGWSAIDLQPGYQLMTGRQALQFCRFRHDATGDYGRMVRQQIFLSEIKRQASRWGSTLWNAPDIIKVISRNTITTYNSPGKIISLLKLGLSLNTSKIYKVHIEGVGTMIDGKSVLEPSTDEINRAIYSFTHPRLGPVQSAESIPRDTYTVRVLNGSGKQGVAGQAAAALTTKGYNAQEDGNADTFDYSNSVVYTTSGLESEAQRIAKTLGETTVKIVPRMPGMLGGMSVIVGSSYTGQSQDQQSTDGGTSVTSQVEQTQLVKNVNQDASLWRTWDSQTPLKLEMPTAWSPGMKYATDTSGSYSERAYTIPTGHGQRAAFVAVGETQGGNYWHIQATSWTDPPIMQSPNETRTINGRTYQLFYQNDRLHRVAWQDGGTLYWISNTLSDQISNDVLLGLATSCKPVS
jgi:LCP family protein required for cell wall assembly